MRHDLEHGVIDKVTFAIAKRYGLTNNLDIRWAQHQLRKSGHLIRKGNRFIAPAQEIANAS